MKKFILVLVVLLAAVPAMAVVTIDANQVGDTNEVDITVEWSGEATIPRAFALDITVDNGAITKVTNYHTGESRPGNKGFGIFPASFNREIDADDPNWAEPNYTPVADACDLPGDTQPGEGDTGVTIEMGSLYVGGPNAPASPSMLCTIVVTDDCNVGLALNIGRGRIVLEDGNEPNSVVLNGTGVTIVCTVPDVVDMTQAAAEAAIIAAGFDIGTVTFEVSMTIADGNVISTDPPAGPASCNPALVNIKVSVGPGDFGDAPDPTYPTQLGTSNGARHKNVGVMLGASRDTETNGQQSANCDGDDIAGPAPDDEDGITNLVATLAAGSVDVNVTNVTASSCYLNAWIDFTNDGDWDDTGEQIFTNYNILGGDGTYNLPFAVVGAVENTDLISRWRVTDVCMIPSAYTGLQLDGEVEDYNDLKICLVPDVVGDTNAVAQAAINAAAGFTVGTVSTTYTDCSQDVGEVVSQNPVAGAATCGTTVDIVVRGPACGDLNCDGKVRFDDRVAITSLLINEGDPYPPPFGPITITPASPHWNPMADVDGNGLMQYADRLLITSLLINEGDPYPPPYGPITILVPHAFGSCP